MASTPSPAPEAATIRPPTLAQGSNAVLRTWLKQNGDTVTTDEPVAELETDKVMVEVFAPCDGVLDIVASENTQVLADMMLGRVLLPSTARATASAPPRAPAPVDPMRFSPAVRRLLAEHPVDPTTMQGTGRGGRLTRDDVIKAIATQSLSRTRDREEIPPASAAHPVPSVEEEKRSLRSPAAEASGERRAHTPTRRQIAQHMQQSLATAPHVTAVFEADLSAILRHRHAHKEHFAQQGAPLTLSTYMIAAAAIVMRTVPTVNSRWHEDFLEVYADVNIGVGTALGERGLVVPVIHQAQNLSLAGIAARLSTLTQAARNGRLKPQDVQGGTFTLSNYGGSGALLAAPIVINQGQAAILGVGAMQKRVIVVDVNGADGLQIRPMAYVTLTIDHRVLNGEQASAWLARFVEVIEGWD